MNFQMNIKGAELSKSLRLDYPAKNLHDLLLAFTSFSPAPHPEKV